MPRQKSQELDLIQERIRWISLQSLDHIPQLRQPFGVLLLTSDHARTRQNLGARLLHGAPEVVYLISLTM